MKIYLAAGHGRTADGKFQPGSSHGDLVEHDLNVRVVQACERALARSGVRPVLTDLAAGPGHDPNFAGAAKEAKQFGAELAIEVHFNAGGGKGTEVLVLPNSPIAPLAKEIVAQLTAELGTRSRGVKPEEEKTGFLKNTGCPAALVEVAFVDGDHDLITKTPGFTTKAGEAIARAICVQHGLEFVSAAAPAPVVDRYEIRLPGGGLSGRFATPAQVGTRVTDLIDDGIAPVTVVPIRP